MDEATPYVMEKYIQHVSENEKVFFVFLIYEKGTSCNIRTTKYQTPKSCWNAKLWKWRYAVIFVETYREQSCPQVEKIFRSRSPQFLFLTPQSASPKKLLNLRNPGQPWSGLPSELFKINKKYPHLHSKFVRTCFLQY